jgi:outer membrane protein assembly factor BamA
MHYYKHKQINSSQKGFIFCTFLLLLTVYILLPLPLLAQVDTTTQVDTTLQATLQADTTKIDTAGFQQQDLKDWIAQRRHKPPQPPKSGNFMLIVPYISSNPTAGFIIGGGLTYTFKASKTDEHISLISSNASYSTNGLITVNFKTNAFLFHEHLVLNSDFRYLVNSESTYGLGTSKPGANHSTIGINGYPTSSDTLEQPLKYNQLRFYETGSFKLFKNFFAGIGFQYDRYYNIHDDVLEKGDTGTSYHYQYNIANGFNPKEYTVSGFSANILYDSRDNQVNAYKGMYANINYRFNITGLGSSQNSSTVLTEYRCFIPLDAPKYRNILGFWLYGNFVASGKVPYLALPALGYDQQQRTGRGYRFGRFRGEDMLYGETEYRFPISMRTGILGGVVFLNGTTTSDRANGIQLMDYIRSGYGGGLRIMLDKASRTRLEIDAGLSHKSFGFYLAALETF